MSLRKQFEESMMAHGGGVQTVPPPPPQVQTLPESMPHYAPQMPQMYHHQYENMHIEPMDYTSLLKKYWVYIVGGVIALGLLYYWLTHKKDASNSPLLPQQQNFSLNQPNFARQSASAPPYYSPPPPQYQQPPPPAHYVPQSDRLQRESTVYQEKERVEEEDPYLTPI